MSDSAVTLRLFFALKPAGGEWDGLQEATRSLSLGLGSRLVPRSNYHLTLAFVGEVEASQLSLLQEIGAGLVAPSLTFKFDAFEYWPKPEVVVAAARTIPDGLRALWEQLHRELAARRWALDPKRLRPHVTVARKVSQTPVLQAMSPLEWVAREFSLMRSDLGAPHPVYTVVDTWPLLYDSEKP